ncbi:MAG: aspartate-alanine antiporter [Ignavibacteria bacterium]|nr:aspartate-alanine antiporter [Ignavibacteria bacterium]MBL0323230.1 aspartate-alanine antiporter [Ignavibacteria bacterium]
MFILDQLFDILRTNTELAFFLALGGGYLVGRIKIGGQPIGAVLGVLVVGLIVGQIGIAIADDVKWILFYLFLFAIGFKCGPQFVHGLRSSGAVQIGLTVVFFVVALAVVYLCAVLFGFDAGTGAGLFAGALTASAALGVAGDLVSKMPLTEAERQLLMSNMTSAFAASYFIGVIITTWFLSRMGPVIMRSKIVEDCRSLETEMGVMAIGEEQVSAYRAIVMRGYRIPADMSGITVADLEARFNEARVFVERVVVDGVSRDSAPDLVLHEGDHVGLSGRDEVLVSSSNPLRSEEISDKILLNVPTQNVSVVVTSNTFTGKQMSQLGQETQARGVFLVKHERAGQVLPTSMSTVLQSGDVLTISGRANAVERVARLLGKVKETSVSTDMVVVGLTIVLGGLIGIPAMRVAGIDLGLSVSVGILIGGLVLGWWYSTHPRQPRIPDSVLWFFDSVGLTGFVAVTALCAGHAFVTSIQDSGLALVIGSVAVTVIPHLATILIGRYVFKVHPGILLGISAGAGTSAPGLAAVQEAAQSQIPTLGYGVTYALGNILLALGGSIIISLLAP